VKALQIKASHFYCGCFSSSVQSKKLGCVQVQRSDGTFDQPGRGIAKAVRNRGDFWHSDLDCLDIADYPTLDCQQLKTLSLDNIRAGWCLIFDFHPQQKLQ
jgi:hypothetical protein